MDLDDGVDSGEDMTYSYKTQWAWMTKREFIEMKCSQGVGKQTAVELWQQMADSKSTLLDRNGPQGTQRFYVLVASWYELRPEATD